MVPDIDKLISHKVRMTELKPVTWNKSGVWEKVNGEVSADKPSRLYYYAAAAVVIVLFTVTQYQRQRDAEIRIANLERSLQKNNSAIPEKLPPDIEEKVPSPQVAAMIKPVNKPALYRSLNKVPQDANIVPEYHEIIPMDVPVESELSGEGLTANETVAQPDEKIEPVVGVILQDGPRESITKAKRKKRLLKLESPPESTPWEEDFKNTLVLARKK